MTIRKKIENDFISRGANVVSDKKPSRVEMIDICLRISRSMVDRIDEIKTEGSSRNAWIRDAVEERLKKEK